MKIPATYAFLAIILAACNTVKPDVKLMGSVSLPTAADVVRVVIDPQRNIRANVYVANDVAMVRLDGKQEQRLIGINPVLYPAYLRAFFRVQNSRLMINSGKTASQHPPQPAVTTAG